MEKTEMEQGKRIISTFLKIGDQVDQKQVMEKFLYQQMVKKLEIVEDIKSWINEHFVWSNEYHTMLM